MMRRMARGRCVMLRMAVLAVFARHTLLAVRCRHQQ